MIFRDRIRTLQRVLSLEWGAAMFRGNPALPVPAANSHLIAKFSPQIVAGSG